MRTHTSLLSTPLHRRAFAVALALTLGALAPGCGGCGDPEPEQPPTTTQEMGEPEEDEDMGPSTTNDMEEPDPDLGPSMDQDTWTGIFDFLTTRECELRYECCTTEQAAEIGLGSSYVECVSTNTLFLLFFGAVGFLESPPDRIRFDAEAWEQCRQEFEAFSCSEYIEEGAPAVCETYIQGLVAPDEPCERSAECSSGACVDWDEEEEMGRCAPMPVGEGQACEPGRIGCQEGLFCDERICQPTRAAEQPCERDDQCQGICEDSACAPVARAACMGQGPGIDASFEQARDELEAELSPLLLAQCQRARECCDGDFEDPFYGLDGQKATCAESTSLLSSLLSASLAQSVSQGYLSIDPQAVSRCVDEIGQASCGMMGEPLDPEFVACDDVLIPQSELGEGCVADLDCVEGVCLEGTCTRAAQEGEACEGDDECVEGTYCASGACTPRKTEGEVCQVGDCAEELSCERMGIATCEPRQAVGEPCRFGSNCQSQNCGEDELCQPEERREEGQSCEFDDECRTDACIESVCATRRAVGEDCASDSDCVSELCDFSNDVCLEEDVALQEACSRDEQCPEGAYCDVLGDGTCKMPQPEGGICDRPRDCQSRVCDLDTNTCVPGAALGESCAGAEVECDTDLYCDFTTETCQAFREEGEPCEGDQARCALGLRCDFDEGICLPRPQAGEACDFDSDCPDDLTCLAPPRRCLEVEDDRFYTCAP